MNSKNIPQQTPTEDQREDRYVRWLCAWLMVGLTIAWVIYMLVKWIKEGDLYLSVSTGAEKLAKQGINVSENALKSAEQELTAIEHLLCCVPIMTDFFVRKSDFCSNIFLDTEKCAVDMGLPTNNS